MSERLTYTVPEVAELLGVSRGVAYESVRCGELPSLRLGRRILVPRRALTALLTNADEAVASGPAGKTPEDARHVRPYR